MMTPETTGRATTPMMPFHQALEEIPPALRRHCRGLPDGIQADFSGNDYLNLSQHPALIQAAVEAANTYGTGGRSSRLIGGSHALLDALEAELANWYGREAALVFPTGWQANVSLCDALMDKCDVVVMDKASHASLYDGIRLAGARLLRYPHLDLDEAERQLHKAQQLRKETGGNLWLVSDSLFSMDGDWPDLLRWQALADGEGALSYLDEAHAVGVFGNNHTGLAEQAGIQPTVLMGTFSKALGGQGGYVVCNHTVRELVINRGRGFIYTTAPPPPQIASALAAVRLVRTDEHFTQQLWQRLNTCFQAAHSLALPIAQAFKSPIMPVVIGDAAATMQTAEAMQAAGWYVLGIRPPTVPVGSARLRLSINAGHDTAVLVNALTHLKQTLETAVLR